MAVVLDGKNLQIEDLIRVARDGEKVELAPDAKQRIEKCRSFVEEKVAERAVMYGITTGIGELSEVVLSPDQLKKFQRFLVYSHSAGCGKPLPDEVVRAAICSRINILSLGNSGIRLKVVETMVEMLNKGVTPVVFDKGSVGACGDLSPMSQMAIVLLGEGEAFYQGKRMPGDKAMAAAGIQTIEFEARDGLATINGSNMTAGYGALLLFDADRFFRTSEVAVGITLEVVNANMAAYDERIHKARGYPGAISCAANVRKLVEGSEMLKQPGKKVQDAYSLRSTPQVVGAAKDSLKWARQMFHIELNGVGDNPIFFPEDKAYLTGANFQGTPLGMSLDTMGSAITMIGVLSERRTNRLMNRHLSCGLLAFLTGANFQGTPLGMSLDTLGSAITMIGVLSERRTNRLMNRHLSCGLPAFLTKGAGMMSGLMLTQYTQGMMLCENRILSAPASVGSIPAAADQEDFVSMSFTAALKTSQIIENAWAVVAIELMAGAQAVEFRKPLKLGKGTQAAYDVIRKHVDKMDDDRPVQYDINNLTQVLRSGELLDAVEKEVGRLES